MGREDEQKKGMTRDEWNYYCKLCETGDSEAVREYMRQFEKKKQTFENDKICFNCQHHNYLRDEGGLNFFYCDIDEHIISCFEGVHYFCKDWEEEE